MKARQRQALRAEVHLAEFAQVRGSQPAELVEQDSDGPPGVVRLPRLAIERHEVILLQVEEPAVSLCLLREPVDFGAIDGVSVHALFTVISPTVPIHLRILAALSLLLHDEELRRLLQERAPAEKLFARIRALESGDPPVPRSGQSAPAGGRGR